MQTKYLEGKRSQKIFSALLFASWISFMAFAGYFAPSFITQLPFFKVKQIEVIGNESIDFEHIKSVIEELSVSLTDLHEKNVKQALNTKFQNRVKRVYMTKELSLTGIKVKLRIVEREPVAQLRVGQRRWFIDREGVMFPPLEGETLNLPEVKTYDIDVLKKNFHKLYEGVFVLPIPIKSVYVKRDKVVLTMPSKRVILPPLDALPDNISGRIKMIYNLDEEKVDLRYGRFILVRN